MTNHNTTAAVQNDYARLAATYEARWAAFLSVTRDWVMGHLPQTPPPQSIFDFGCGTGVMLQKLGTRFPDAALTGVDISPAMLEIAAQNAPQATLLSDKNQVTTQHDLVLSLNVLHHLPDAAAHLEFLRERCAQGGTIILCDFAIDGLKMGIAELYWRVAHPAHNRAYSSNLLRNMIEKKGLRIQAQSLLKPDNFWRLQIYKLTKP